MEEWGARAGSGQGRDLQGLDLSPGEMVTESCQESPSEGLEMGLITPSPAPRAPPRAQGVPGKFGAGAALTAAPGGQDRGQQQQQDERQPHAGAGQGDTGVTQLGTAPPDSRERQDEPGRELGQHRKLRRGRFRTAGPSQHKRGRTLAENFGPPGQPGTP